MSSRNSACLAAVVVCAMFAGCAGGTDDLAVRPAADAPDVVVDGTVVRADSGIFRGQVTDDAGFAIPGARLVLVGESRQAESDAGGRFEFVNVTAGTHYLRVESPGFGAHDLEFEMEAGGLVNRTIVLIPSSTAGAGYRPHTHDYWGQATERTIFDAEFDIRNSRVGSTTADLNRELNYVSATVLYANTVYSGLRYWVPLPTDPNDPMLVYPGAGRIEVTFDWNDAAPMPPEYAFAYIPANDRDLVVLSRGGPGTTWTIEVAPDASDHGHQAYSLWEFYVIPVNNAQDATNYRPSLITENVHVSIKVFRGMDPPVEPPHPAFWAGGDSLALRNHSDASNVYTGTAAFGGRPTFGLTGQAIVPPGTSRLLVELVWTYATAHGSPVDQEYVLYWNTAEHNYNERPVSQWATGDKKEAEGGRALYEIELKPTETDGYYQQKTSWRFAARIADADPDRAPDADNNRGRTFTLSVVAVRDPAAEVL